MQGSLHTCRIEEGESTNYQLLKPCGDYRSRGGGEILCRSYDFTKSDEAEEQRKPILGVWSVKMTGIYQFCA